MKAGDVIESSVWVTGDEPTELRQQYENDMRDAIADLCSEMGFTHGPVVFHEKPPGADRVPPVPSHIQGSRVMALIAESTILEPIIISEGSFVSNLDRIDLERLRTITRRAWNQRHPNDILSDRQCDETIEALGPQVALDTLRANFHTLQ